MKLLLRFYLAICSVLLVACGYTLQGTKNPLHDFGIQTIYVKGFTNITYRPGLEQMFTTAMIREIEKGGTFRLVSNPKDADAILTGVVTSAESSAATTTALTIPNSTTTIQVASEYTASISCQITLKERNNKVIFDQSFSGSKNFSGDIQTGDAGATVPTTNDSQQRVAYQFLSADLIAGAYQRMIDLF
jgi:hypothetical protein